ncbi:MAG: glycosyltransferase [Sphingobium sp.]|nr:glycosyltransferase [Sphingobium sp.]
MLRSDLPRPDMSVPPPAAADATSIMVCLKGFGPGGVERIALRLVEGWRGHGLAADLLVADADGPMRATGSALAPAVAPAWPLIGRRAPLLRLLPFALREIRERRPAILFCPGNSYTALAVTLKLLLGRACPTVVAKISNDLERPDLHPAGRPFYRLWLRVQARAIDHVAALSAPMAREAMRLMHMPAHRVHLVPNPVLARADLEGEPVRSRRREPGRRFVAVGRLERQKDYPLMLRAFAAARQGDDRLVIYGEGRARHDLERLAHGLGLAGQVVFAGYCADVRARLAEYDILLLTSAYEGQPGAVVEALSAGLGIVATRCCAGMAELLDDGALGMLVDRGDLEGMIRAIATASPDMQDRPRARARARAFTIEAAVPAYAALFARLSAERARKTEGGSASPFPAKTARAGLR